MNINILPDRVLLSKCHETVKATNGVVSSFCYLTRTTNEIEVSYHYSPSMFSKKYTVFTSYEELLNHIEELIEV